MIKLPKKEFWGGQANETWHLFISSRHSNMPFVIENIGTTGPHPRYCVKRDNSKMFIIEYVTQGKGYIYINGKMHEVVAGDTYIIEPGIPHCYFSDKENPMGKVWINFTSDIFHSVYKSLNFGNQFIFKDINPMPYFNDLFAISKTSSVSEELCYSVAPILFDLIFAIARHQQKKNSSVSSLLAMKVKQILDESLFSYPTIEDISETTHFSKKQIIREFKKCYRDTPHNYLLNMKIKMAKRYLKTSNMSIKEISDTLGFDNQHYFSSIFRKKVGMSPSEYRAS